MRLSLVVAGFSLVVAACTPQHPKEARPPAHVAVKPPKVQAGWGQLPLRFEENRGQTNARVRYVSRERGLSLFLTDDGATMALADEKTSTALRMTVHDGAHRRPEASQPLVTRTNYFIGNDEKKWVRNVPSFGAVTYRNVRPGVDLVYHGSESGRLEYDFVVQPGASPDVSLDVEGADLRVAKDGALELVSGTRVLRQLPPVVYQTIDGQRREVKSGYRLVGKHELAFNVETYDRSKQLVIDPVIVWSSLVNGADAGESIQLDASGNVYVTGGTGQTDFPTTTGTFQTSFQGNTDTYVAKLAPSGSSVVWATYVGGSGTDTANRAAIDGAGSVYITGSTQSPDYPLRNALFGALDGGTDAFVTELSADGSALVYSTYLGGVGQDAGEAIVVDASKVAYVAGYTTSSNFPVTSGAYEPNKQTGQNGFVAKIGAGGTSLVYATFLGAGATLNGVAADAAGHAYVTGNAAANYPTTTGAYSTGSSQGGGVYTELSAAGDALVYSTYLGPSDITPNEIALDGANNVFLGGAGNATDVPTSASSYQATNKGSTDVYVMKFTASGTFVGATYLGGSDADVVEGFVIDSTGAVVLSGVTGSSDFPTRAAAQGYGGNYDAFVAKLSNDLSSLVWSTYLGGSNFEEAISVAADSTGSVYLTGETSSTNFPVTAGAFNATRTDGLGFVTKLGYAALAASPSSASVAPLGSQSFALSGGTGAYSCAVTTTGSGSPSASVTGTTCAYTAGSTGGNNDVITVTDTGLGTTLTITVTVGASVSISPTSKSLLPGDSFSFAASGGSGTGYSWSFASAGDNASGSPTTSGTGATFSYTAGSTNNVVDTLTVVDSLGNTAQVKITVGAAIAVQEGDRTVAPNDSFSFHGTGGLVGTTYTFSLVTSPSAFGTITTHGVYTAPDVVDVGKVDTVQVSDGNGHTATAFVTVGAGLSITMAPITIAPGGSVQLGASGGSGTGYAWATTQSTGSTATITSGGLYTAGHSGGATDTITLTDSTISNPTSHNVATVMIKTTAALAVSAPVTSISPSGTVALSASGGEGSNYHFAVTTNQSSTGSVTQSTSDPSKATYQAGTTGSTSTTSIVDTITVTDDDGNSTTISITVTQALAVSASTTSPDPHGTVTLTASHGSGTYTSWVVTTNKSGAILSGTTGASITYTAGGTSGSDKITVTDSTGSTASITIGVGNALVVNPSTVNVKPKATATITPMGGLSPYTFALETNPSGSISAASGTSTTFTAGLGASGVTQTDTLTVTDSNGVPVDVTINTGPKLEISPTTLTIAPSGTKQFTLTGGDTSAVTWSVTLTHGASISTSGLYTAGSPGSDTVTATDKNNNVVTASITVGPALTTSVSPTTVPPRGSATFAGMNGQSPYAYMLTTSGSAGDTTPSINPSTGVYKAGSMPDTTDKVTITDSNNVSKVQAITIGAGVTIAPATPAAAPHGTLAFSATGGNGAPYTWSISVNNSGGTIDATGAYTAGANTSVVDTVTATDSLGNSASVNVSVGGGVAITPAAPTTAPRGTLTFTAQGGSGSGFAWKVSNAASGGSINTTSGIYIAGPTGNVQDTISVTDSDGNAAQVMVAVGAPVQISPPKTMTQPGTALSLSVMGGSGMGYVWSFSQNASGGTLDQSGAYVAGTIASTDVVAVTDSLGNTAVATIGVEAVEPPDMGTDMAMPTSSDMSTSHDASSTPVDSGSGTSSKSSGCGCDVGGARTTSPIALLVGIAFALFTQRRRFAKR